MSAGDTSSGIAVLSHPAGLVLDWELALELVSELVLELALALVLELALASKVLKVCERK